MRHAIRFIGILVLVMLAVPTASGAGEAWHKEYWAHRIFPRWVLAQGGWEHSRSCEFLQTGEFLESRNGNYRLIVEADGFYVARKNGDWSKPTVLWRPTGGTPAKGPYCLAVSGGILIQFQGETPLKGASCRRCGRATRRTGRGTIKAWSCRMTATSACTPLRPARI